MVTISRSDAANSLLIRMRADSHILREKIGILKRKHGCDFNEFSSGLGGTTERFEAWDDFMEWKALRTALLETEEKIPQVEKGEFTVA